MSVEERLRDAVDAIVGALPRTDDLAALQRDYERRVSDPLLLADIEAAVSQAELDPPLSVFSRVDIAFDDVDNRPMMLGRIYEEDAVDDWEW